MSQSSVSTSNSNIKQNADIICILLGLVLHNNLFLSLAFLAAGFVISKRQNFVAWIIAVLIFFISSVHYPMLIFFGSLVFSIVIFFKGVLCHLSNDDIAAKKHFKNAVVVGIVAGGGAILLPQLYNEINYIITNLFNQFVSQF